MPRLAPLALAACLLAGASAEAQQTSLRFFGHGVDMIDRVKIRLDDPGLPADPGPPADVGATDFTIEFFLRATAAENVQGGAVTCNAPNIDWIYGNIVLDRDRYNQDRKFGISIADGVVLFGVSGDGTGDFTICGTTDVLDDAWHHVAVQRRRSDGRMEIYVDGALEGIADGPDGDISYPDDGVPMSFCGETGTEPCDDSDPFLVIGAEKHDADETTFPSFSGSVDELRVSSALRYAGAFPPPTAPFPPDADTAALYHFDGSPGPCTGTVADVSGASGGPSDGECRFGGDAPAGPLYAEASPFGAGVPAASGAPRLLTALAVLAAGTALLRRRSTSPRPRAGTRAASGRP